MKKKKIIVLIIIGIIVTLIGVLLFYQYSQHRKQKQLRIEQEIKNQKIESTKQEYEFYLNKEILENPEDDMKQFLNSINQENKKNETINYDTFAQNVLNSNTLDNEHIINMKQSIDNEISLYTIESLTYFTKDNLLGSIQNEELDKDTLIQMYEEHEFIKNLEEEKTKRKIYIQKLETLKSELDYLLENTDEYYIQNNEYICKNDEILNKFNELKEKYNLEINVSKEIIYTSKEVPILCYHGVLDVPWGITDLFVRVNDFEAQMQYLSENGYTPIFVSEIEEANRYEKPIIITFDDGYKDVYTNAYPILQKYKLKANVYMISGWIGGDVYMTSDMTIEMSNSPLIEIGSHTVSHKALANLSNSDIEYEVSESKKTLEAMLNKEVKVIAYPTGSFDERVTSITSKYYQYGLSTIDGKENTSNLNTYTLKRIYVHRNYSLEQFKNIL